MGVSEVASGELLLCAASFGNGAGPPAAIDGLSLAVSDEADARGGMLN
jgi:hypothetical protein